MRSRTKIISQFLTVIILISVALCVPVSAGAETLTSGDYKYTLNTDDTIDILGYTGNANDITIPSEIDGRKVTSIADRAFWNCTSLKSITIPNSVTTIGKRVFGYCYNLTSINADNNLNYSSVDGVLFDKNMKTLICYPAGKTDFYYTIPDGVTTVGADAFFVCSKLTAIEIPSSVTKLEDGCLAFLRNLQYLDVEKSSSSYTSIDGVLFDKSVKTLIRYPSGKADAEYSIPNNVTVIGKEAFYDCVKLSSVNIPNGVTNIQDEAFNDCDSLASITIPDSVTSIGGGAFRDCNSLETATLGKGLKSIGGNAFSSCEKLASIKIPDSVTSIGSSAFSFCESLESVNIPNGVTNIGQMTFMRCVSLASITIPDSVTDIENFAFDGCTALVSATLGKNVKRIGESVFLNCSKLASVNIPYGANIIDYNAFKNCSSLTSITIPNSVKRIEAYAFDGCDNLTIYGYSGSCAEYFADRNNIVFVVLPNLVGDVDSDGFVNIIDATLVQKHIAEIQLIDSGKLNQADTNGDGIISVSDVTLIQKYAAGMISEFSNK